MRLRAAVSAALASAGILLAGWQSGTYVEDTGSAAASTSAGTGTGSGTAAEPTTGATAKAGGTYAGSVVQTRFGAVQVQISVKSGAITDVVALQLTDDDRKSIQISNRAAPLLRAEVLAAQSADVQTIGGATVTSDAYLNSLQAAIDAANL